MHTARNDYLKNEVMTASSEKLQLMLIEGALRMTHQARTAWQAGDDEAAFVALIRAQHIVCEMISGLDPKTNADLVKRITAVYLFVYKALMAANLNRDLEKLNEAVRVLEVERETWRMVTKKGSKVPAPHMDMLEPVTQLGQSFVA